MPNTTLPETESSTSLFTVEEQALMDLLLPLPELPGEALSPGGVWMSDEEFDLLRDAEKTGEPLY